MQKAIFPGSFDPITKGHINIIKRASKIFDLLFIGIFSNPAKNYLFSLEEREKLIKENFKDTNKIKVVSFDGLLADYLKENKIKIVLRGIRNFLNYEDELFLFDVNKKNIQRNRFFIFPC